MQVPPCLSLLPRSTRRVQTEATKYVRNEFRDDNPSWLISGAVNNGHAKHNGGPRRATPSKEAAAELPSPVLMRDGCGAEH